MDKAKRSKTAYEVIYNYRYMLETGYSFDEYAQTIAHEIDKQSREEERDGHIEDK